MDKPLSRANKWRHNKWSLIGLVAVVSSAWAVIGSPDSATTVESRLGSLQLASVQQTEFTESLTVRGVFVPKVSIYLDAIEGGRVEQILAEDGALVKKGQPLVVLSNTAMQLDVISREAQITEQLNNLQNTELAVEQNSLRLKKELAEMKFRIAKLEREKRQLKTLANQSFISADVLKANQEELDYLNVAMQITAESQALDQKLRDVQLQQLRGSVSQLQQNLEFARRNLDSLVVKAPMDGRLSALTAELGQSKLRGERIGQIDDTQKFKVIADVDEYYLSRLVVGQQARLTVSNELHQLELSKIYPQVDAGKFKVEFAFSGTEPALKRGQNLSLDLLLSGGEQRLTLPLGSYLQDGGHWVYVMAADGQTALRRQVQLGRRNQQQIEVLSGLQAGEKVIVSSYQAFNQAGQVNLKSGA